MSTSVSRRYAFAGKYFVTLKSLWAAGDPVAEWLKLRDRRTELEVHQVMALIHPRFYQLSERYVLARSGKARCPIRGDARFQERQRPMQKRCECRAFWGYDCDGKWIHAGDIVDGVDDVSSNKIEMDHSFPYALGGVTELENLRQLCGLHNRLKASDIHIWPWDEWCDRSPNHPQWAGAAIDQIGKKWLS